MRIILCAALALVTLDYGIAANGCGPAFYRTVEGACVPNDRAMVGPRRRTVILPPPCPRGYLRDSNPARPLCYPVF